MLKGIASQRSSRDRRYTLSGGGRRDESREEEQDPGGRADAENACQSLIQQNSLVRGVAFIRRAPSFVIRMLFEWLYP